jgi:hypothetical protein
MPPQLIAPQLQRRAGSFYHQIDALLHDGATDPFDRSFVRNQDEHNGKA